MSKNSKKKYPLKNHEESKANDKNPLKNKAEYDDEAVSPYLEHEDEW
ncbi:hypothetical protein [Caproiciproducens sp. MSJ-32]|nr:hypothetical protein [Caproiciproducens sp. MSJ-32]MBU5454764.1 hypothetical protein [Caproiciproducens sp. MSJ-32]